MSFAYTKGERLLTIDKVTVSYDFPIVKDVSFVIDNIQRPGVDQGQTVALLGPSGIGKTQLFRCIAGLQRPNSGMVRIGDNKTAVQAGDVGVVMQNYPLMPHRTVWGNLKLVAKTKEQRARAEELLNRFRLLKKRDLYPSQLSGGQRQRVAIIQQLLCATHFLLMDEPFSGLDPIAKADVCGLLNEINLMDELNTTLLITHDLESALVTADTIIMLGRDYDEGNAIPGANIKFTFDLIERGLAWRPNIDALPEFYPMLQEVKDAFKKL